MDGSVEGWKPSLAIVILSAAKELQSRYRIFRIDSHAAASGDALRNDKNGTLQNPLPLSDVGGHRPEVIKKRTADILSNSHIQLLTSKRRLQVLGPSAPNRVAVRMMKTVAFKIPSPPPGGEGQGEGGKWLLQVQASG